MSSEVTEVKCPFFIRVVQSNVINGISCEGLAEPDTLGFSVETVSRMTKKEVKDYLNIFCEDMYETCPYYRAMMAVKYADEIRKAR